MKIINMPIEVIAETKIDGKINPLKIRISEDEDQKNVCIVDGIVGAEDLRVEGYKVKDITCFIISENGVKRQAVLRMYIDSCKWVLHKI